MKTQDILPVILSVLVILLVAILEKQSKLVAALAGSSRRLEAGAHTSAGLRRVDAWRSHLIFIEEPLRIKQQPKAAYARTTTF